MKWFRFWEEKWFMDSTRWKLTTEQMLRHILNFISESCLIGGSNRVELDPDERSVWLDFLFLGPLNSDNGPSCFSAVMDYIHKVFGIKNQTVRHELEKAGYLGNFDLRYSVEEQDLGSQGYGKLRCYRCGKYKDDWEITVDTISPHRTENICEDCLSKKQQKRKKEDPKNKGRISKNG